MMRKKLVRLIICLSCITMSGCGTTVYHLLQSSYDTCEFPYYVYSGAAMDVFGLYVAPELPFESVTGKLFFGSLAIVDFPLSVAADTVILPFKVTRDLFYCL